MLLLCRKLCEGLLHPAYQPVAPNVQAKQTAAQRTQLDMIVTYSEAKMALNSWKQRLSPAGQGRGMHEEANCWCSTIQLLKPTKMKIKNNKIRSQNNQNKHN